MNWKLMQKLEQEQNEQLKKEMKELIIANAKLTKENNKLTLKANIDALKLYEYERQIQAFMKQQKRVEKFCSKFEPIYV